MTYTLCQFGGNKLLGTFYERELQKLKIPIFSLWRKVDQCNGDKVNIRYLGFDK